MMMEIFRHAEGPQRRAASTSRYWGDYALWVGNIPSQTTVMNLRDYFSETCAQHLLSISYNPDAKYAFVNFSTEEARLYAIGHAGSRLFEGRRLDCRIRQDATSRSTKVKYGLNQPGKRLIAMTCESLNDPRQDAEQISHFPEAARSQHGKEKYFIIKSGSMEALSHSLETGQWFVPNRHVKRLNHAFQTASKVYFIFSVNGSGRFFGCATMKSEIQQSMDTSYRSRSDNGQRAPLDLTPTSPIGLQRAPTTESRYPTYTLASDSSDSSVGSVSYEPERRRIIWKAAHHDLNHRLGFSEEQPRNQTSSTSCRKVEVPPALPTFGSPLATTTTTTQQAGQSSLFDLFLPFRAPNLQKEAAPNPHSSLIPCSSPCQIKWLSCRNISFDVVRGLKNIWNSSKEVYVARNITAVDPIAGATLLGSFNSFDKTGLACWPGSGSGSRSGSRP